MSRSARIAPTHVAEPSGDGDAANGPDRWAHVGLRTFNVVVARDPQTDLYVGSVELEQNLVCVQTMRVAWRRGQMKSARDIGLTVEELLQARS